MEGSLKELSQYRFQRAQEDLETAAILLREQKLKSSVNRSYYAIFHALRALTALIVLNELAPYLADRWEKI